MCVGDEVVQSLIALNNNDGEYLWNHMEQTYGAIKTTQILLLWRQFLEFTSDDCYNTSMLSHLNRLDVTIYKLQSAKEVISDNLKIAILLKALPQESYESFTAAVQFQNLTFEALKEKVREKAFDVNSHKTHEESFAGHKTEKKFPKGKSKRWCSHCKSASHD